MGASRLMQNLGGGPVAVYLIPGAGVQSMLSLIDRTPLSAPSTPSQSMSSPLSNQPLTPTPTQRSAMVTLLGGAFIPTPGAILGSGTPLFRTFLGYGDAVLIAPGAVYMTVALAPCVVVSSQVRLAVPRRCS